MWFVIVLSLSIALASLVIVAAVVVLACFRFCPACRRPRSTRHQHQQAASQRNSLRFDMPPPYPGPFIPGVWPGHAAPADAAADEASGGCEDGACGGLDVAVMEKKLPPLDDQDEGHFVPDAVEMNAKLAAAIPPPPHLNHDDDQLHRHHRNSDTHLFGRRHVPQSDCESEVPPHRRRHHRGRHHHAQPPQLHARDSADCFVPDDDVAPRLHLEPVQFGAPAAAPQEPGACRGESGARRAEPGGSAAGWWRQVPAGPATDSSTVSTVSSSVTGGTAGGSSSSSRRWSPASLCVPSTTLSTSLSQSSQSRLVFTDDDDPDTTQTDIDYY